MKLKFLILGALACGMFAACSNDDEIVSGGEGTDGNDSDCKYITVNIVSPRSAGTAGTRGVTGNTGDFIPGEGNENAVGSAVFLFFDDKGNSTQSPVEAKLGWTDNKSTTPAVEKISTTTIIIAGNTQPSQILAVLNPPAKYFDAVNGMNLTDVCKRVNDYGAYGENEFVMSNSVYVETQDAEGNDLATSVEVNATDITGHTFKTQKEAEGKAVDIYVERILAKVITSATPDGFAKGAKIKIGETEYPITQTIEGIEIANIAKKSRLVKSIENWDKNNWTASIKNAGYDWEWNDPDNKRSYWAVTPSDNGFVNRSWTAINEGIKDSENAWEYEPLAPTAEHTFYIQPNTYAGKKTSVLVTATLKNEEGEPFTFLRWAGQYYFKDAIKEGDKTIVPSFLKQYAQLLHNANFEIKFEKEDGTIVYCDIDEGDLRWLTTDEHKTLVDANTIKGYQMTAKLSKTTGLEIVRLNSTTNEKESSSITAVNNFLLETQNLCWLWEGGKCYYFVNIEHSGPKIDGGINFHEGVVRNHIYDLNLESLTGVGVPVFNPDEEIIPEKPSDDLYYLAAKINILKWKLVKQNVKFE